MPSITEPASNISYEYNLEYLITIVYLQKRFHFFPEANTWKQYIHLLPCHHIARNCQTSLQYLRECTHRNRLNEVIWGLICTCGFCEEKSRVNSYKMSQFKSIRNCFSRHTFCLICNIEWKTVHRYGKGHCALLMDHVPSVISNMNEQCNWFYTQVISEYIYQSARESCANILITPLNHESFILIKTQ